MQRTPKTKVELGELKSGDRFYFASDAKRIVYQVTVPWLVKTQYNLIENDVQQWAWDKEASSKKQVIFLRHTI